MSKILITGSNGFLGSRLSGFLGKNHCVKAPSHSEMDFTDEGQEMDMFRQELPDVVIHCGAVSDVRACEENPSLSYKINVQGTENMARACRKYHAKMIFCSSDQIYFQNSGMEDHIENEKADPKNEYGRQKLEAENICLDLCPDAVCLRLAWMYDFIGYNNKEHQDLFRNVVTAVKKGNEITFPVHDYRGITYVKDILKNIEKTFVLPGGIYNFGSENDKNTYETVKVLLDLLGKKGRLVPNTQAFLNHPRNIKMNTAKIRRLGIDFPSTVMGFQECVADYKKYWHIVSAS